MENMRALALAWVVGLAACGEPAGLVRARARRDALIPLPAMLHGGSGSARLQAAQVVIDATLPDEGYVLDVDGDIRVRAHDAAGAFWAQKTLEQLFGDETLAAEVHIVDQPRYPWRGLMLDVARHFFGVDQVKRWIDLAARYKLDRVHLHLTDDQGWRIEIQSWPALTTVGGASAVGGAPGGFYTQAQFADLVAYAKERFITLVPEIDMPGHCNAALASYAQLTCDGVAKPPYTGTDVGMSAICTSSETTYQFLDQVIGELAPLLPDGLIHVGGDEAHQTAAADYTSFMTRLSQIVAAHGLQMIGWEEIAKAGVSSTAQLWLGSLRTSGPVILSPSTNAYLDMKYDANTPVGATWAGFVDVDTAYDWDPSSYAFDVIGVEGALWTENIATQDDADRMIFPRLLGHAELAWGSPHDWNDYRRRLGAHAPRLRSLGVNFYPSTLVDWTP
jgi:hexosaminidase